MSRIHFFMIILLISVSWIKESLATPTEDTRIYFFYMKGAIDGQKPFADGLATFKQRLAEYKLNPKQSYSPKEIANLVIESHPKSGSSPGAEQIYKDLNSLAGLGSKTFATASTHLQVYMGLAKYLMSGNLKAPRHYENLTNTSEDDLRIIKETLQHFVSQSNAGTLTFEESEALDQVFRYYIGTELGITNEEILENPIMFPLKHANSNSESIQLSITESFGKLAENTEKRISVLEQTRLEQTQRAKLESYFQKINQLTSFTSIDHVVDQALSETCVPLNEEECEKYRKKIIDFAETQKANLELSEKHEAISQSIQLGLSVGKLTGNEDIVNTFRVFDTLNNAFDGVSKASAMLDGANTGWGKAAGLAMGATSVLGAGMVLMDIFSDSGPTDTSQILAAIEQLRVMLLNISFQLNKSFQRVETNQKRIEGLISAYGRLNSGSLASISAQIQNLDRKIFEDQQPLSMVEITYRKGANDSLKELREISYDVTMLPTDTDKDLFDKSMRTMFRKLFTIIDFVRKGEYRIGFSGDTVIRNFGAVLVGLSGYSDDRLRSAFILQTLLNTSELQKCRAVNLIGYGVVSEASNEINTVLDKVEHKKIADFLASGVNQIEFKRKILSAKNFLKTQQESLVACLGQATGLPEELQQRFAKNFLAYVQTQKAEFFSQPQRLNDYLLVNKDQFQAMGGPGEFIPENFKVGYLVAENKSFDIMKSELSLPAPYVKPISYLGDANSGFAMERAHFNELVLDPAIRLLQWVGGDVQYEFTSYWEVNSMELTPFKKTNEYVFNLVMTVPSARKVVHVWPGSMPAEDVSAHFITWTQNNVLARVAAGSVGAVYDYLKTTNRPEKGFVSAIRYADDSSWSCTSPNGLLECRSSTPYHDYYINSISKEFVHEEYFASWHPDSINPQYYQNWYYYILNNNDSNTYRPQFLVIARTYVTNVQNFVTQSLGTCLRSMMVTNRCALNETAFVSNPNPVSLSEIDNLSLMRIVLSTYLEKETPASEDKYSSAIRTPGDIFQTLWEAPPQGSAPDFTLSLLNDIEKNLEEELMQKPAHTNDNVSETVLENDYFWLFSRVEALSN